MLILQILFVTTKLLTLLSASDVPVVIIDSGAISGTRGTSYNGREYQSFEGIPYAEPPVGKLRFSEPVKVKAWTGVKVADKPGNICLQIKNMPIPEVIEIDGVEDCLFINVHTPKLPNNDGDCENMDVVVFIHGGSWMYGSGGEYGPRYYMDEDLVFVTFNYRVGILGFSSTGDEVNPGNNGMKDQVLALQWVQKNIQNFCGNPNSVTITGQSVGGSSVHYHYLSPLSKGLFHKGISFSGTALDPWAQAEAMPDKTRKIAETLNCPTYPSLEMIQCLRTRDAYEMVNLTNLFQVWLYNPDSPFGPMVEIVSPKSFICKEPVQIIIDGEAQPLPWMSNLAAQEGLYPVSQFADHEEYLAVLDSDYRRIFPALLEYMYTVDEDDKDSVSDIVKQEYFGEEKISKETVQSVIQMMSDRMSYVDAQLSVQLQAKHTLADVYSYIFGYRGRHSFTEWMSGTDINWGVSHCDDIAYFMEVGFMDTDTTQEDREMRKVFLKILTSYFKTGIPIVPQELGVEWIPESKDGQNFTFLHIKSPESMQMNTTEDAANSAFWKSLPIHENNGATAND